MSLIVAETGGAGRLDNGLEVSVIGVAEPASKVAAGPEFIARRVGSANGFKRGEGVVRGGL